MKINELVKVSMFAALSVVLSLFVVFRLGNGGSISLYLVPVVLFALKKPFKLTVLCALIIIIAQMITGSMVLGILQVILDYVLPVFLIATISIVRNKSVIIKFCYIILIGVLVLASYTASGMVYFGATFYFSLTYNITHFIPTYLFGVLIAFIIEKRLVF